MSDLDDMMKLYKEIQENYIKALERENEELRTQREKDALKIEELEKRIHEERNRPPTRVNNPAPIDDTTVIGPGTWYPYKYPQPSIWDSYPISTGDTLTSGISATYTTAAGETTSINRTTVDSLRKQFEQMREKYLKESKESNGN